MVRTRHFQGRGPGFIPAQGTKIPQWYGLARNKQINKNLKINKKKNEYKEGWPASHQGALPHHVIKGRGIETFLFFIIFYLFIF